MTEYTYKDIIIDPTSEEAKNAVGKIRYFSNSPRNILSDIYCKSAIEGILTNMDDGYFEVDNEGYWDCIILKKEEPKPKYVPFKSKEEFIEAFHYHDNSKYSETEDILMNYGMWLKDKNSHEIFLVTGVFNQSIHICDFDSDESWGELLNEYTFLDGSPCGKLMEE